MLKVDWQVKEGHWCFEVSFHVVLETYEFNYTFFLNIYLLTGGTQRIFQDNFCFPAVSNKEMLTA